LGSAVPISTALIRAGVQSGHRWAMMAAAPATCGVAIEVPDRRVYHSSTGSPREVPVARAATMSTPGAVMSGFMAKSPKRGPRLEKSASRSWTSTAPTVRAEVAAPGVSTVCSSGPELPAATTNRVRWLAVSRSTAWLTGSLPSVGQPPRLMLTTRARWLAAHSMPAITPDSLPKPKSSRTLPLSRSAPNATPLRWPAALAPVPATVEATWVPCPSRSVVVSDSEKLAAATTWPARSGWVASMPVSRTATRTPSPVRPCAQTVGTRIWVRLGSRAVLRKRRSSQTRLTPASGPVVRRAETAVPARAAPNRAAVARGWRTAVARTLASSRTGRSDAAVRPAGRLLVPACWAIMGRLAAAASA
jgi:hypothetical protein